MIVSGWKTNLVSFVMLLFGVLAEKGDVALVNAIVNPAAGKALVVSALVMAFMRWVTEQTTVKRALNSPPPTDPPTP